MIPSIKDLNLNLWTYLSMNRYNVTFKMLYCNLYMWDWPLEPRTPFLEVCYGQIKIQGVR